MEKTFPDKKNLIKYKIKCGGLVGKKILIVEDEADIREALKSIFATTDKDYELYEAVDGAEAISKYKKFNPDLILLDILMPEVDGLQVVKKVLTYNPKANILIITALGDKRIVAQAVRMGVKGYITKPFEFQRIIETVEKIFS